MREKKDHCVVNIQSLYLILSAFEFYIIIIIYHYKNGRFYYFHRIYIYILISDHLLYMSR